MLVQRLLRLTSAPREMSWLVRRRAAAGSPTKQRGAPSLQQQNPPPHRRCPPHPLTLKSCALTWNDVKNRCWIFIYYNETVSEKCAVWLHSLDHYETWKKENFSEGSPIFQVKIWIKGLRMDGIVLGRLNVDMDNGHVEYKLWHHVTINKSVCLIECSDK